MRELLRNPLYWYPRLVRLAGTAGAGVHIPYGVRDAGGASNLAPPTAIRALTHGKVLLTLDDRPGTALVRDRLEQRQQQTVFGKIELSGEAVLRLRCLHPPT